MKPAPCWFHLFALVAFATATGHKAPPLVSLLPAGEWSINGCDWSRQLLLPFAVLFHALLVLFGHRRLLSTH